MKRIIAVMLLIFGFSSYCFAQYVFEDYQWGESLEKIKEELSQAKNPIVWENKISYDDAIFDRPCKVEMDFTSKEKLLYKVSVFWDLNDQRAQVLTFGENIRDWINDKYSNPSDMIGSQSEYVWGGKDNPNRIELFYLYPTRLIYYGGKYYQQFLSEDKGSSQSSGMSFSDTSEQIVT